jgi:cystathionine beta-lyase
VSSPFDQPVSREHTCSVKFDARKAVFGTEDVIPVWVADMDFAAPEAVTRALRERAEHPVYGYTLFPDSLYQSMIDWYARILLLCSPHNPVGRVWSEEELTAVLDIARRHRLVVVSDEIHCDLTFTDKPRHTMLAKLAGPEDALVTAVAPSKSFNMPGLGLSALVIPDADRRKAMKDVFESMHLPQCNPFSIAGFEAGYRHGAPWLDDLMAYLQASRDYVVEAVGQRLPAIRVSAPEGTYLMWLDCRELGLDDAGLKRFFVREAGVGMNPGLSFGDPGSGFMRLNIGCARSVLEEVIGRIEAAL